MRFRLAAVIALILFCSSCDEMSSADGGEEFVIFGEDNVENTNPTGEGETKKVESIQMRKEGGVFLVPAIVNGIPMEFIMDTGASMVSISVTEANFFQKQGLLDQSNSESILFEDANGNINEGKVIVLKSIKLGNRTLYNIKATVVQNLDAPLLLGQSVLSQFGKISIDYSTGTMELE
jgi:aspartyl protease family protein